jgi:hypothetical protein
LLRERSPRLLELGEIELKQAWQGRALPH